LLVNSLLASDWAWKCVGRKGGVP